MIFEVHAVSIADTNRAANAKALGKRFFFEKKNQKTSFILGHGVCLGQRQRHHKALRGRAPNEQSLRWNRLERDAHRSKMRASDQHLRK
jgi:hypothetical protein